jgi:hypothetical protein
MNIKITWLKWPMLITLLTLAPMIVYGSLLDWLLPVGKIADAAKDITIAIVLKQFLDQWMPLLATLAIAGCSIACFFGASKAVSGFGDSFRSAMADHKITLKEAIGLVAVYPFSMATAMALLWFGGVFAYMSSGALLQYATSVPVPG